MKGPQLAGWLMLWVMLLSTSGAESAAGQKTSCPDDPLAKPRFTQDFSISDTLEVKSFRRLTGADPAHIDGIHFAKSADFDTTRLDSASFTGVFFAGGAKFFNTEFGGPTLLTRGCALFLDFGGARFKGPVVLSGFHIQRSLWFKDVAFDGDLTLRNVTIGDSLDLAKSSFGGHVELVGTRLPRIVDLSDVQDVAYAIDLTNARTPATGFVYVSLLGANLDRIRIDYLRFRVAFPDSASFDERASVYERLLVRFRSDGRVESYKNIDIEYKQFRNKVEGKWIRNLIQRYWWNYGYNKEYVFGWSFALLVFFSVITVFFFDILSRATYRIPFIVARDPAGQRSVGNRIVKALLYTGVIFFGIKLDLDRFDKLSWWTAYVFLVYAVGLVCVAYMLAFVLNR